MSNSDATPERRATASFTELPASRRPANPITATLEESSHWPSSRSGSSGFVE
ncbi:hypothetical protein [Streptomyces antimycoticus]|uniref:hypothetical protein n=1 Tax=Streptomyces antimycoticus TaxID=68175 RepID=UPI0037F377D8